MAATAQKEVYASGFPREMQRAKYNLTLNERLREARKHKGYSLKKVVDILASQGVKTGVSTIQGYECQEDNINHRYPNVFILQKLINIYGCSADFLFDVEDEILDLSKEFEKVDNMKWKGQKITNGQKALICEKINEIINL